MRALLPAMRADLYEGALPWVAAQDAEGESGHGLGGYGMGLAFPAKDDLIDLADLVTEMTLVKHPFRSGIKGQKGVEF